MISAVILNWKRPANVRKILDAWRGDGIVTDPIVWNNNPAERFSHDWAKVINANQDLGLYTRFAAACLAERECVLIQDDDLLLPASTLRALHEQWLAAPHQLHGIFGRVPKADGTYADAKRGNVDLTIVLTRALLMRRDYAARFFALAETFAELQKNAQPQGNGEDILLSYLAHATGGYFNRIHDLPVTELPAPHSIHGRDWKQHVAHRTRLMQACERWLAEQLRDPLRGSGPS